MKETIEEYYSPLQISCLCHWSSVSLKPSASDYIVLSRCNSWPFPLLMSQGQPRVNCQESWNFNMTFSSLASEKEAIINSLPEKKRILNRDLI